MLEIGSASGNLMYAMKNEGADVTGIELTEEMGKYSKNMVLKTLDKPITKLKLESKFDLIASFHCLEHVSNPTQTFMAIRKARLGNNYRLCGTI